MSAHLRNRGVPAGRIAMIPNWADGELIRPIPPAGNELRREWGLEGRRVIGYSGNLGRAHDLPAVRALVATMSAAAVLLVGFVLFSLGGVGGGDVKLLAACALWMGPGLILPQITFMAATGLVLAMLLLACRYGWRALCQVSPARMRKIPLPLVLEPGRTVPYGIAIAASAAWVSLRGDGVLAAVPI
jgi:Flp pilus assembly protein protease CpaA